MSNDNLYKEIENHVIGNKEKFYRLAYSYVKNPDYALDIVHESILKAFSSIDSLKNNEYIKTWFYRIVVNTSIDFLRKQKHITFVDEETLSIYDTGKLDKYEDIDLKKALDDLPKNYRIIIILRYFEDLKLDEIAEILNENVNTIKTRLYKSLEILRIKMID